MIFYDRDFRGASLSVRAISSVVRFVCNHLRDQRGSICVKIGLRFCKNIYVPMYSYFGEMGRFSTLRQDIIQFGHVFGWCHVGIGVAVVNSFICTSAVTFSLRAARRHLAGSRFPFCGNAKSREFQDRPDMFISLERVDFHFCDFWCL